MHSNDAFGYIFQHIASMNSFWNGLTVYSTDQFETVESSRYVWNLWWMWIENGNCDYHNITT